MAMKSNTILNLAQEVREVEKRIPSQEYTLCKGLKQPFNNTNSGSRKIMQGIQMEQATQLLNPEVPIVSTGYENQFGELNSNFVRAEHNYVVIDKIPKFDFNPNIHYWLILLNTDTNEVTCIERIGYKHITEFYGYLYDNEFLDSLTPGDGIDKGTVMQKTISYDEYNNRAEGINLTAMYIACEDVKEDPIVISESASKRFAAPMIDKVEVRVNDNDILLNLYGQGKDYKTFPNIGENIKDGILCAVRRELKDEEALYSQSWERLKVINMADRKYNVEGQVIDIDVFCNNPEKIDTVMYNNQIKYYYEQTSNFAKKFVKAVEDWTNANKSNNVIKMSYILQKEYKRCKDIIAGKQYVYDKVFNNIVMYVYVQQNKPLERGDKVTDRYGGKGVISRVKPDNMMPHYLKNGKWIPVDVLYSKCTCFNRLNDGQVFETSITYAGWQLLQYIQENNIDSDTAYRYIWQYINLFNPEQAQELLNTYRFTYKDNKPMHMTDPTLTDEEFDRDMFVQMMLRDGYIMLCLEPISSGINIDKLAEVYKLFPFLHKYCPICVPQMDSNGNYRMVRTYRDVAVGFKYIFRLKQFAIEKFSVVSLASTNIRNENSKSRLSKTHNARFPSTPVRIFGEMEASTIGAHVGTDILYEEFLLTTASPIGRREHERLTTGDPFEFNIELNPEATSLNADIGMAYLKTLGAVLRFGKIKKFVKRPLLFEVMRFSPRLRKTVMYNVPKEYWEDREAGMKWVEEQEKKEKEIRSKPMKEVMEIVPGIKERTEEEIEYIEKKRKLGLLD